ARRHATLVMDGAAADHQLPCSRIHRISCSRTGTFIPLRIVEGEAFQFDWSEDWAIVAGECTKLQAAQVPA
ncbi:hypothetical protein ACUXG4_006248, partial [Cupriavidus metallidurans]